MENEIAATNTSTESQEAAKQPLSLIETDNWLNDTPTVKEEKVILENVEEKDENGVTKTDPLATEDKVKEEADKKAAELAATEKESLAEKAKELNLPETATKEEVEAAEKLKVESAKTDFEFKVPGTDTEDEDGSWISLGKSRNYELKEDTFEAYTAAETAHWEAKLAEVRQENVIAKYKPEVAVKLEMLEAGITEDEIFAPTQKLDAILAKSATEKVRFAVEQTPGITPELVDAEMELLAEKPELIEHRAKMIDLEITNQKKAIEDNLTQRLTQFKEQKAQEITLALEKDAKELEMTLSSMKEFRGQPVKEDVKKFLANNWRAGKYDNAFKDSKVVAEFLMQLEFGKDLDKHYKESILSDAKKNVAKQLHNTPETLIKNQGTTTKNNTPTERFGLIDKAFG